MSSVKKAFQEYLAKNTQFKMDYTKIRSEIEYPEEETKLYKNFFVSRLLFRKISFVVAFILVLGFVFIFIPNIPKDVIYKESPDLLYNPSNVGETVAYFDYIFIGKIDEIVGISQYDGTGTDIPYTLYSISIFEYLKGQGPIDEEIVFYGGTNELDELILYMGTTELPKVDQYYIFLSNKSANDYGRIKEGQFIISSAASQMILLENFNDSHPVLENNSHLVSLIKPFLETIGFYELFDQLLSYDSPQELINELSLLTQGDNLDEDSYFLFNLVSYIEYIDVSGRLFVIFAAGPLDENQYFKIYIFEIQNQNGKYSLYKTNQDRPLLPSSYVYTTIDYRSGQEYAYDNKEIIYYIEGIQYSIGFSVVDQFANKEVLYNNQASEKVVVEFLYNNVTYKLNICYAETNYTANREFNLIDSVAE